MEVLILCRGGGVGADGARELVGGWADAPLVTVTTHIPMVTHRRQIP